MWMASMNNYNVVWTTTNPDLADLHRSLIEIKENVGLWQRYALH